MNVCKIISHRNRQTSLPLGSSVTYGFAEGHKKMNELKEVAETNDAPQSVKHRRSKKDTRDKILKAALQVFTQHPYQSASIRMISKLGEVDHALISYHFGSKAELYKSVLRQMMEQRLELQKSWLAVVKPMAEDRGFSIFLDNLLEDYNKRPGLFHVISLNFQQADPANPIPGHDLIEEFIKIDASRVKEILELNVPDYEAEMFIRAMSALLIQFLGSAGSYAKMMGMEPDSIIYFNWVKDTVIYALLPRLKQMMRKSPLSES